MLKMQTCVRPILPPERVFRRRRQSGIELQLLRHAVEQTITHAFGITPADLWSLTRGTPRIAFARQVGMYVAHVALELSLTEVGMLFNRDRTTVAHACSRVEDQRDDRTFDRALELLENVVRLLGRRGERLRWAPASAPPAPAQSQSQSQSAPHPVVA